MKEQTLKVICDNCGSVITYNHVDEKYEHKLPIDENTLERKVFDFCSDECKKRYLYENYKEPLFYHDHITGRANREPEYFMWEGKLYYDFPYTERTPAEILRIYEIDNRHNGSDAVNSLLFIMKDFKYGSISIKGIHQYVNTNSNKENVYDSRHNGNVNGDLLLELLNSESDLNLIKIYLKDLEG